MLANNKLGVIVDSFGLGVRKGLLRAKEIGADGVQIYAVEGEMDPANLKPADRRELCDYFASHGMEISALCGEMGGHGFQDKIVNPMKIEKSKRILDLAVELGTNIVTTHIGPVPEDTESEVYEEMQKACAELNGYANSLNAYFAIETGPESPANLKRFLDSLGSRGVAVNYDPANLVMVNGYDAVEGVRILKDYIVHTHVKDGIRYKEFDSRYVYVPLGYEPWDLKEVSKLVSSGEYFREVALGEGQVDFKAYFAALDEIGYKGYVTVEREVENPEADIRKAIDFIRQYQV
ncbi:sugar phosphate isomerase/epimerase family protein [Paenibacillus sepulcri]|uniref:TIM barrel protein n=1 Tax=Paenibacillus sepulcri TaxID=359917 RepID=A0ABS7BYE3_9BACL|nr:TIM barrel protein [Paenibacillus sepulcri]